MNAGERAFAARQLLRRARSGTLATLTDGAPYASLVTVAADHAGDVLLLLSDLADHTRNLKHDPRASLLVEEGKGLVNPQIGPRVGLQGRVARIDDSAAVARFLARHPSAQLYAGFADFAFYRLSVERAHYVGGFARAHWIESADWHPHGAASFAKAEATLLRRINGEQAERIQQLAREVLGRRGSAWRAIGCDPDGIDLRQANRFARLAFSRSHSKPADCLAALAKPAGDGSGFGVR